MRLNPFQPDPRSRRATSGPRSPGRRGFNLPEVVAALAMVGLCVPGSGAADGASTLAELEELRGEHSRTLTAAGELRVERSPEPLHYRAPDGTWQPIDTALVTLDDGSLVNDTNALVSRFPATADGSVAITRREDGAMLQIRFASARLRHADGSIAELGAAAPSMATGDGATARRELAPGVAESWTVRAGGVGHDLEIDAASLPVATGDVLVVEWLADVEGSTDLIDSLLVDSFEPSAGDGALGAAVQNASPDGTKGALRLWIELPVAGERGAALGSTPGSPLTSLLGELGADFAPALPPMCEEVKIIEDPPKGNTDVALVGDIAVVAARPVAQASRALLTCSRVTRVVRATGAWSRS